MKIEIDFSKPESLRKQRRELEMALTTIDGALAAINKNWREGDQQSLPHNSAVDAGSSASSVSEIIAAMPKQFDMRQAKSSASAADIPVSQLRREIEKLMESGELILVEKGKGRRPTSFRKA